MYNMNFFVNKIGDSILELVKWVTIIVLRDYRKLLHYLWIERFHLLLARGNFACLSYRVMI